MSDNMMTAAFNKQFSGAEISPVMKAALLGFFANGWEAAEKSFVGQLDDYTRRMSEDLEEERKARANDTNGWIKVVDAEYKKLKELYEEIAIEPPNYYPGNGLYQRCFYCGKDIEENPENHADNCLWVRANRVMKGEE